MLFSSYRASSMTVRKFGSKGSCSASGLGRHHASTSGLCSASLSSMMYRKPSFFRIESQSRQKVFANCLFKRGTRVLPGTGLRESLRKVSRKSGPSTGRDTVSPSRSPNSLRAASNLCRSCALFIKSCWSCSVKRGGLRSICTKVEHLGDVQWKLNDLGTC